MAEKVKLTDVAAKADPKFRSWEEMGLEALPGWVICRAVDDGPPVSKAGLHVVRLEKEMRPMVVEVLAAGPQGTDPKTGKPDGYYVPGLPKGQRVIVPEYGVKIHEDPVRGDLRCYEYRQLLALYVNWYETAETSAAERPKAKS